MIMYAMCMCTIHVWAHTHARARTHTHTHTHTHTQAHTVMKYVTYICTYTSILTEPSLNAKLWKTCGRDFKKECKGQPGYTIIRCLSSVEDVRVCVLCVCMCCVCTHVCVCTCARVVCMCVCVCVCVWMHMCVCVVLCVKSVAILFCYYYSG